MSIGRKYARDPKTGNTIDGVSFHKAGGYYVILPDGQRQYYGRNPDALQPAKAAYDRLTSPPKLVPAMTLDDANRELTELLDGLDIRAYGPPYDDAHLVLQR